MIELQQSYFSSTFRFCPSLQYVARVRLFTYIHKTIYFRLSLFFVIYFLLDKLYMIEIDDVFLLK